METTALGWTSDITEEEVRDQPWLTRRWLARHRRHGAPFIHAFNDGWSWYACTAPCNQWHLRARPERRSA